MPGVRKSMEKREPVKTRLKKNDVVLVLAGRDKGKKGRIIEVDRVKGRVVVEGVMMMKRHTRPNPAKQIKGGIAEREASVHISNVSLMNSEGRATRIGVRFEGDGLAAKRVRYAIKGGDTLDKK